MVQLKITVDKKINGIFSADTCAEYPVILAEETVLDSEKTVTLNFDPLLESKCIRIHIPLPIGTYGSLSLELNAGAKNVWSYSKEVTNTINRRTLLLMPTVSIGGTIDGTLENGEISGEDTEKEDTDTPDVENTEPTPEPKEGAYVDEYGINHGQGVEIDGVVWAPVNCGYHATDYQWGKLYQWGRVYGQGYSGEIYIDGSYSGEYSDVEIPEIVRSRVSLEEGQSVNNKNVFYTGVFFPYNWLSTGDDTLWNSGTEKSPVKTENDPCPSGWRVPTYAELDGLHQNRSSWTTNDAGQSGYWFSGSSSYEGNAHSVFFPAAGHRLCINGTAYDRGFSGNYWTSRSYDDYAYAYILTFDLDDAKMSDNDYAYGRSVRCVMESSGNEESTGSEDLMDAEGEWTTGGY